MFKISFVLLIGVLFVFTIESFVSASSNNILVGAPKTLSGNELKAAEDELKNSLRKVAAGNGPNYRISTLKSATRQTVAGLLYKFDVDLVNNSNAVKKCNVEIWSKPWEANGVEVTFKCEGEPRVVKHHNA